VCGVFLGYKSAGFWVGLAILHFLVLEAIKLQANGFYAVGQGAYQKQKGQNSGGFFYFLFSS